MPIKLDCMLLFGTTNKSLPCSRTSSTLSPLRIAAAIDAFQTKLGDRVIICSDFDLPKNKNIEKNIAKVSELGGEKGNAW